jgi:hypothetical protein
MRSERHTVRRFCIAGRFMSPDPLGGHLENPQSLNKYVYALNNPLTNTDRIESRCAGPLIFPELDQIFGGWSLNFGFNTPTGSVPIGPGIQVSANGSGVAYGPTVGVAGASVSATYAPCGSF